MIQFLYYLFGDYVQDVLIFSADDYSKGYFRSLAIVDYTGNVFWAPPTKFRSTCSVNVMYFPFDDQSCQFKLSSWMYDGTKVNLELITGYFGNERLPDIVTI